MDLIIELRALLEKYSPQNVGNQTRKQFCRSEAISESSLKKLEKRGLGPKFERLPGLALKRITPEERVAWRARMKELVANEAASSEQKIKEARALKQRREAGRRGGRPPKRVPR